jgi:hypothetical protein
MQFGFTMGGERSIIDNFDNILSSGESCLLSTASPRVSGFLSVCVPIPGGEQIPPQTGHCEGVRYSIENPAFGTPKVEVLPPATTLRCSVARWTRASRASFGPRSTGCSCCSRFTATPTPLTTRTGFSPSRRDSSVANVLGGGDESLCDTREDMTGGRISAVTNRMGTRLQGRSARRAARSNPAVGLVDLPMLAQLSRTTPSHCPRTAIPSRACHSSDHLCSTTSNQPTSLVSA